MTYQMHVYMKGDSVMPLILLKAVLCVLVSNCHCKKTFLSEFEFHVGLRQLVHIFKSFSDYFSWMSKTFNVHELSLKEEEKKS